MTDHFQIRKDMPPPTRRGRYPFNEMEINDSFTAPRDMGKTKQGHDKRQTSILGSGRSWAKHNNPNARFTVRILDDNTVGCWRVK